MDADSRVAGVVYSVVSDSILLKSSFSEVLPMAESQFSWCFFVCDSVCLEDRERGDVLRSRQFASLSDVLVGCGVMCGNE